MEERKKFKETKFGKWLAKAGKAAPDVIESVGMAVGGPWGTVVAKVGTALGNVLDKDPNNQEAKDLLAEFEQMKDLFRLEYEYDTIEVQEITKRWEADGNSDSKLAKNVRPIFLLYTLGFVSVCALLDSIDPIDFSVKEIWITLFQALLMTAVVAYFGGRSWEKSRRGR
jgi:hypothetical protein